jgi:hypothetical protein
MDLRLMLPVDPTRSDREGIGAQRRRRARTRLVNVLRRMIAHPSPGGDGAGSNPARCDTLHRPNTGPDQAIRDIRPMPYVRLSEFSTVATRNESGFLLSPVDDRCMGSDSPRHSTSGRHGAGWPTLVGRVTVVVRGRDALNQTLGGGDGEVPVVCHGEVVRQILGRVQP